MMLMPPRPLSEQISPSSSSSATAPWVRPKWISSCRSGGLRPFQLGVLLHQLLQTEARELYRNLGIFPISFALIDRSFAIFRVLDLLSGTKSALAGRLFDRQFRDVKFLSARGE